MDQQSTNGLRRQAWSWAWRGAALGFAWGLAARAWMRFISTDPEFTWAGTGYIVLAAATVGLSIGTAEAARRNGWGRWPRRMARGAGIVSIVVLGVGAGTAVVPTVVLGALAAFRRRFPLIVRAPLAALALPTVYLVAESLFRDLALWRAITGLILYLGLLGLAIAGYGQVVRSWRPRPAAETDGLQPAEPGLDSAPS